MSSLQRAGELDDLCDPAFHIPRAISSKGIKFYLLFSPQEYAGVYLQWHQIEALQIATGLTLRTPGFDHPWEALQAHHDFCRLSHAQTGHPPLPSVRFNMTTFDNYNSTLPPAKQYRRPPWAAALSMPPAAARLPPTPLASPTSNRATVQVPSTRYHAEDRSTATSATFSPLPPPPSEKHSRSGPGSWTGSTATGRDFAGGAGPRAEFVGGVCIERLPRFSSFAEHAAFNRAPSSASTSYVDVSSWVDQTAAAVGELCLDDSGSAHALPSPPRYRSYVLAGDGLSPTLFKSKEAAKSTYRALRDSGNGVKLYKVKSPAEEEETMRRLR
ncbi:hypothetical protein HDZ31DRAFT_66540 [Schizophyllum fasciatum]